MGEDWRSGGQEWAAVGGRWLVVGGPLRGGGGAVCTDYEFQIQEEAGAGRDWSGALTQRWAIQQVRSTFYGWDAPWPPGANPPGARPSNRLSMSGHDRLQRRPAASDSTWDFSTVLLVPGFSIVAANRSVPYYTRHALTTGSASTLEGAKYHHRQVIPV